MISRVNTIIQQYARPRSIGLWLFVTVVAAALFGTVFIPDFELLTGGHRPPDTAFPATPQLVFEQFPDHTAESRRSYLRFAVADFVFAPALALLIATFWAWLIRWSGLPIGIALAKRGLLLLPLATAVLDWLETAGFLVVILNHPTELRTLAAIACMLQQLKLFLHAVNLAITVLLVVAALVRLLVDR